MNEPNAEGTSIPGRSWPGADVYKSLKLGWHWRRLRWAVVAASEAAQGHEANGLPPGSREFKTLFNEVASKVQEYSTESGDPLETLKARLPALCALERLANPAPTVPRNKAGLTLGILIAAVTGANRNRCADWSWDRHGPLDLAPVRIRRSCMTGILELFALVEIGSGIGFLATWRNRLLASKVNYFRPPHNKKSPFDKLVRAQTGRVITRQDQLCVKVADGLTVLVRRLVLLDAFRQLMRAVFLPNSPLRRSLRTKKKVSHG